ncbi:acetoin utilization protein AcuC [Bacillus kwashiorkori]|uniref:acetoin utilization protein AcuC n=1 Tax=Bacillus kwashiorkori TaxID=1522318 RepID=UPI000781D901|nr:acetoin utilization protein AcuC [Bacillus kwashiorkori]
MKNKAAFVYSDQLLNYKFHANHPFNQQRIKMTLDLLQHSQVISDKDIIPPRFALEEELLLAHDQRYINAVKKAGMGELQADTAESYGLGTEDTPIFQNMHEASSLIVGGTLTATDLVMQGEYEHALHLGGGLHHGLQGKASGFCIYNDCSIAIKYILQKYQAKVLYIDTDAHHGDGVQWAFYDNPNVCTFSIHETGRYLFPGTGSIYERGHGEGYGYTFNIPLDAFTEDESFMHAYRTALVEIVEYFKPDVIFTQNGADAHYYDPLTHLSATMRIYREIPKLAHELAHQYCNGRWIAVGGGGYDIWRVVPRAWAFLWLEMIDHHLEGQLPEEWLHQWQKHAPVSLPTKWEDEDNIYPPIPRRKEINEKNRITVDKVLQIINRSNSNTKK